ncbi:MAG: integration host factor subunit alpha [Desulfobacteraceae bacterium]|nr:MAG: integration host factor subunit alpha [Desulfobacteraceae bacterium]
MTLTKADLIEAVSLTGCTKKESEQRVEVLLEIIKKSLENGEDVLVSGFGKFCVRNKKERKGRNPATGADLLLSRRRVITFRCSSVLRDRMNGKA